MVAVKGGLFAPEKLATLDRLKSDIVHLLNESSANCMTFRSPTRRLDTFLQISQRQFLLSTNPIAFSLYFRRYFFQCAGLKNVTTCHGKTLQLLNIKRATKLLQKLAVLPNFQVYCQFTKATIQLHKDFLAAKRKPDVLKLLAIKREGLERTWYQYDTSQCQEEKDCYQAQIAKFIR